MFRTLFAATFILIVLSGCVTEDNSDKKAYILKKKNGPAYLRTKNEQPSAGTDRGRYSAKRLEYFLELARLRHQEKMASIEAEKSKTLKKMENQTKKDMQALQIKIKDMEAKNRMELEKEKQKEAYRLEQSKNEIRQKYLIAALAALLLILIFLYIVYRKKTELKKREMDEKLKHEKYLLESRQHHERVSKMMDMVADPGIEIEVRHELAHLLKDNSTMDKKLIEYGSERKNRD